MGKGGGPPPREHGTDGGYVITSTGYFTGFEELKREGTSTWYGRTQEVRGDWGSKLLGKGGKSEESRTVSTERN